MHRLTRAPFLEPAHAGDLSNHVLPPPEPATLGEPLWHETMLFPFDNRWYRQEQDYFVHRVKLGPGIKGTHTLNASQHVGLQVMGYGKYTSYQYPGGLDLARIAPPPPK